MKVLVIRKAAWFKRKPLAEKLMLGDIEVEILYRRRIGRNFKKTTGNFIISEDFEEFESKGEGLMELFPVQTLKKAVSRHGIESDGLEVVVDKLSEKNREILIMLSFEVRFMTIRTHLPPESFDFLLEEAGISPKIVNDYCLCEKLTVYLGEEFLIKHNPSGKTYYDIKLKLPDIFYEYYLPEGHSIFSEYIRCNPEERGNVKISDFMSK